MNHDAIYALYSNVKSIDCNGIARDIDGNEVAYDLNAVNIKATELQEQELAQQQAQEQNKQNAVEKLTALGLTQDEILSLGVQIGS